MIRVTLYPSHDGRPIRRMLAYLSFSFTLSAMIFGLSLIGGADVVYLYEPPPTIGLPALLLKWFRGMPIVYHIQDMWA